MRLNFIDVDDKYKSVLLDILNDLGIRRIQHNDTRTIVTSLYGMIDCRVQNDNQIEVDTDYERFEYAKFLFEKEVARIKRTERQKRKNVQHLEKCLRGSTKKRKKKREETLAFHTPVAGYTTYLRFGDD